MTILQINAQTRQAKTQSPLVHDPYSRRFTVIAIQGPWVNPHKPQTSISGGSYFSVAHGGIARTRACLYVSKAIDQAGWTARFPSRDVAILDISLPHLPHPLRLINVYSPSPTALSTPLESYDNPCMDALALANSSPGPWILVGDFNMWQARWTGASWPLSEQHTAAEDFVAGGDAQQLSLVTPPGLKSRQGPTGRATTIDLALGSPGALEAVVRYGIDERGEHGSDHRPVGLALDWQAPPRRVPRRPLGSLDGDRAAGVATAYPAPWPPQGLRVSTKPKLADAYALELQRYCDWVLDEVWPMPRRRARPKEFRRWAELERAVGLTRARVRQAHSQGSAEAWEGFRQGQGEKVSLARRLRRDEFGLRVAQVCDTADMWKLGKWARHRSQVPAQPAGIPSVRGGDGSIGETNTEKEAALAEAFFPEPWRHAEPTGA